MNVSERSDSEGGPGFRDLAAELFKARFPLVYVQTWEEERALAQLASLASDGELIRTPRKLFTWSLTAGLVEYGQPASRDATEPLEVLDRIEQVSEPALFVLKDLHVFFGSSIRPADNKVVRRLRDIAPAIKAAPNPQNVVLMSPTVVLPVELQKDVSVIDFELPSEEEIRSVLLGMIEANRQTGRVQFDLQPDEEEQLIQAALGLTLHEAENAFARAMVGDGRLDSSDIEVVLEEKRQVIKKTGILEFIHATEGLDAIGGLDNLKDWLTKRERAWLESARRYNLPPPRGLLITGVPGCGKSLTAKCASALWQFPLLRLDIGRVFGGLVGSSEQNMRAAIRTAEAIAPSVLWIDEIEKGFSGSTTGASHDSGTSSRIFGTFLTWMQEKNRPVFVMATANAIDVLPPEFLRKGRFDEIFFVDLPNAEERAEIFDVHLRKRLTDREVVGDFEITRDVLIALAELADGYNGAEIEQSVIDGLREAHYEEERAVRLSDFQRSIQAMVPLSVTQAEQIHMTREWAKQRAVPATTSTDEATAHDVRVEAAS